MNLSTDEKLSMIKSRVDELQGIWYYYEDVKLQKESKKLRDEEEKVRESKVYKDSPEAPQ